jgi:mannose-6-phosphate isomerase-like protein (cupin superfamily)
MSEKPKAIVVRPEDRKRMGNLEFISLSEHTSRFNLAFITKETGEGPPAHTHADEEDSFLILEGELTFTADGEEIVAGPGTFVLIPPGVEHTFANRGETPVKIVNIHAPAGFDRRMLED